MAETANIAKIAEILSKTIFSELGWEKEGPTNINWECVDAEHNTKTHPSDIVFSYQEPYESTRTYINCDLKSYSKDSINNEKLRCTIESLVKSVSCAQKSKEWQDHYLRGDETADVIGLLFIYNHDGLYDKKFGDILQKVLSEKLNVPRKNKIFIFSPEEICSLNTIINDIHASRGEGELPEKKLCSFFHPDQISRKVTREYWKLPATIEMLKSSFLVLKHKTNQKTPNYDGITMYYKRRGSELEEFIYLIDYLFHWQIISENVKINIKLTSASNEACAVFSRAIKDYTSRYNISSDLKERLKNINIETVKNIVSEFNTTEIGMEY
jgi:hypothetical protein